MIFEIVCGIRGIDLTLSPSSETGYDLVDKKIKTIARGDRASISKLKIAIEQLVSSEEIHSIVSQYHELKNKLDSDQNVMQFNYVVAQFHEYIHGGKVLGGPGSCDLCTDVEFEIN